MLGDPCKQGFERRTEGNGSSVKLAWRQTEPNPARAADASAAETSQGQGQTPGALSARQMLAHKWESSGKVCHSL